MYRIFILFCKLILALGTAVFLIRCTPQTQCFLERTSGFTFPSLTNINLLNPFKFSTSLDETYFSDNTSGVFLLFLVFLFSIFFVTVAQSFITLSGALYVATVSCLFLLVGLFFNYSHITALKSTPLLELKIYSIYNPIYTVSVVFSLDYLSTAFMFLVVAIATAAILYARVYLYGDPNTVDFLVKLLWFVFSMLSLVLCKNFIFLYFSWEFIGITSMWLINFNSQRLDTNKSALKAFTFNKVSDLCLFTALLLGAWIFNSPTITDWRVDLSVLGFLNPVDANLTVFSVLMAVAACIKSAQLGFHLWLPDSMDAPVPASALIHSATLVSAGIYLLLRFLDVIVLSGVSQYLCLLGAVTAVYGGVVAGAQTDLKRALAYSTISHCGFLFVATLIGGSEVALLYLFLHGFYKALSFICAGEAIRVSMGYQDLNKMGGLLFICPSLASQFLVAMGNLCGLPFFLGYLFKSNFQLLLLTNNNLSVGVTTLLTFGLLSSLFYFFKVFYSVIFTFKKNNYKNYLEFFKKGLFNSNLPLKNPKTLIFIFWFVTCVSFLCIFEMFEFRTKAIGCSYLDNFNLNLGVSYFSQNDQLTTQQSKFSYFFLFYALFTATVQFMSLHYFQNRCVGLSAISRVFTNLFCVLSVFIAFAI